MPARNAGRRTSGPFFLAAGVEPAEAAISRGSFSVVADAKPRPSRDAAGCGRRKIRRPLTPRAQGGRSWKHARRFTLVQREGMKKRRFCAVLAIRRPSIESRGVHVGKTWIVSENPPWRTAFCRSKRVSGGLGTGERQIRQSATPDGVALRSRQLRTSTTRPDRSLSSGVTRDQPRSR